MDNGLANLPVFKARECLTYKTAMPPLPGGGIYYKNHGGL